MGVIVAQRLGEATGRKHRTLEERLYVRLPAVPRVFASWLGRLSPRSRLRQRLTARAAVSGWAGVSRQDIDLVLTRYAKTIVQEWPHDFVALGLPERAEGHRAWRDAWAGFQEAWVDYSVRPAFLIDGGGSAVILGRIAARGRDSGAEVDRALGQILDIDPRTGLVGRERFFSDWGDAIAAAGIDPGALQAIEAIPPAGVLDISPHASGGGAIPA